MSEIIQSFAKKIEEKKLQPKINLDRPIYIQPEDSIKYRSARLILICGMLDRKYGLNKKVISCVDFLLRNPGFQKLFIISYFREKRNLNEKLKNYNPSDSVEIDFNIIQYKSVPWDLRFNDMLFLMHLSNLVEFEGERGNIRIHLTDKGKAFFNEIKEIFIDEVIFLDLFGKEIHESKLIEVITKVIPNTYWRENEKLNY